MDPTKLRTAIGVIAAMEIAEPRAILEYAVKHSTVPVTDGWVMAALNCNNDADIVEIAVEFLLADCRGGFVPESNDGSSVPEA